MGSPVLKKFGCAILRSGRMSTGACERRVATDAQFAIAIQVAAVGARETAGDVGASLRREVLVDAVDFHLEPVRASLEGRDELVRERLAATRTGRRLRADLELVSHKEDESRDRLGGVGRNELVEDVIAHAVADGLDSSVAPKLVLEDDVATERVASSELRKQMEGKRRIYGPSERQPCNDGPNRAD